MFLSIVIPVYNVDSYIEECLETLLKQNISVTKYEIICVDDGSTDKSGAILDSYAENFENIRVIHKENGGVSSARNEGIEMARGDYVWFVDADDFVTYNVLDEIFELLKNNSVDMLFVKPMLFNNTDSMSYKMGLVEEDASTKEYWDWLWTRIIKRSILVEANIRFHTSVSYAEDCLFCTMLNPYIKNISHYDRVVYYYRKQPNSVTALPTELKINKLIESSKVFLEYGNDGKIDKNTAMRIVCANMCVVMNYLAKLPKNREQVILEDLRSKKLFPLKKQDAYSPKLDLENMSIENSILNKLKHKSYTRFGYYMLRYYRKFLKLKRRIIK